MSTSSPRRADTRPGRRSGPDAAGDGAHNSVCVFDPTPLLTVTIESSGDDTDIHCHAGGQGFWIARMAHRLGAEATLVGSFGGEPGMLITPLIEAAGVRIAGVTVAGRGGSYVQDRRSGSRSLVAESHPVPLTRHELDDLYGAVLAAATGARVTVLAGPSTPHVIPHQIYGRLAADLNALRCTVVADLSGETLRGIAGSRLDVLKVSEEDMVRDGFLRGDDPTGRDRLLREWSAGGIRTVIWTRADRPALALTDGRLLQIACPQLRPVDHRGAGDAMTAAVAVALSRDAPTLDALRLGAAAGAAAVTRHGLATGRPDAIGAVLGHVEVRDATAEEVGQAEDATAGAV